MFKGLFFSFCFCLCYSLLAQDVRREWITKLSHDDYQVREEATQQLISEGKTIVPALKSWLKKPLDAEQRHRIERVLSRLGEFSTADHRLIGSLLKRSSTEDFLTVLSVYGDGLKKNYPDFFSSESRVDCDARRRMQGNQSIYEINLKLQAKESAWLPKKCVKAKLFSDLPFPKVYLDENYKNFCQLGLMQLTEMSRYELTNKQLSTKDNWVRRTKANQQICDVVFERQYLPGKYEILVEAYNQKTRVPILNSSGQELYQFQAAECQASYLFKETIDAFDESLIAKVAPRQVRDRKSGLEIEATLPVHLPRDQDYLMTLKMTAHWFHHNYTIVLPDFEQGKFLTLFWRRIEKEAEGEKRVLETFTQRLDPREEVYLIDKKEKYASLYPQQNIVRDIKIKTPQNPGKWEMIVCYGAFGSANARSNSVFTTLVAKKKYFAYPIGAYPSPIYEVEIH